MTMRSIVIIALIISIINSYKLHNINNKILNNLRINSDSKSNANALNDYIPNEFSQSSLKQGCVLLSQPNEHDHFLYKSAVFIFNHDIKRGSQGVILTKQTAFSMGEVSPNIGPFVSNTLYMGGEQGPDMATMLHTYDLQGQAKYIGHGIYLGGLREAQAKVIRGDASPKDFKFFFNCVEWTPGLLEKEIDQGRWNVIAVPPVHIIGQSSGDLWVDGKNFLRSLSNVSNEEEY